MRCKTGDFSLRNGIYIFHFFYLRVVIIPRETFIRLPNVNDTRMVAAPVQKRHPAERALRKGTRRNAPAYGAGFWTGRPSARNRQQNDEIFRRRRSKTGLNDSLFKSGRSTPTRTCDGGDEYYKNTSRRKERPTFVVARRAFAERSKFEIR